MSEDFKTSSSSPNNAEVASHEIPTLDSMPKAALGDESAQPSASQSPGASVNSNSSYTKPSPVNLQEGRRGGFNFETQKILRQRLTIVAMTGAIISIVGSISSWSLPYPAVRISVCVILAGAYALLRSQRPLNHRELRWLEVAITLLPMVLVHFMSSQMMIRWAEQKQYGNFGMEVHFELGLISLAIMLYSVMIPNRWPRALLLASILAVSPYIGFFLLARSVPAVNDAFSHVNTLTPLPLPLAATFVAVFTAEAFSRMRKSEFKARKYGQYILKEKLGSGGMGDVYRAEHLLLKRPSAIKLIRPGIEIDQECLKQFKREVEATSQLSHWNTVEIYDFGVIPAESGQPNDDIFYYVMELLPGMNLHSLVRDHGPLSAGRTIYLARQVCAALAEAHDRQLIHRDIKPGNIYVSERGGEFDVIKLLDFGLVLDRTENADESNDEDEKKMSGSPPYMSPEQGLLGGAIGPASDIYSVGCVLYFMMTGQGPFKSTNAMAYLMAHARQTPSRPSDAGLDVPPKLENIMMKCLEKTPTSRYLTIRELESALASCPEANDWGSAQARRWWHDHRQQSEAKLVKPSDITRPQATITVHGPTDSPAF